MAKTVCKILGVVLLLVGVCGFVAPRLLGAHLTPAHNVVHLLSGSGIAFIRDLVYGWKGSERSLSIGPISTILPDFIMAKSSPIYRAVDRSCVM